MFLDISGDRFLMRGWGHVQGRNEHVLLIWWAKTTEEGSFRFVFLQAYIVLCFVRG